MLGLSVAMASAVVLSNVQLSAAHETKASLFIIPPYSPWPRRGIQVFIMPHNYDKLVTV